MSSGGYNPAGDMARSLAGNAGILASETGSGYLPEPVLHGTPSQGRGLQQSPEDFRGMLRTRRAGDPPSVKTPQADAAGSLSGNEGVAGPRFGFGQRCRHLPNAAICLRLASIKACWVTRRSSQQKLLSSGYLWERLHMLKVPKGWLWRPSESSAFWQRVQTSAGWAVWGPQLVAYIQESMLEWQKGESNMQLEDEMPNINLHHIIRLYGCRISAPG